MSKKVGVRMKALAPPPMYKIVLGTSADEYKTLLSLKVCLGERFHLRHTDTLSEFVVGLCEQDLESLDENLRRRVMPMSDEGIVRNCVPILYRMMGQKHIDEFINEGKIRLSTFFKCSTLEAGDRRDGAEGSVRIHSGGFKVASGQVGHNAYLLCTSLSPFASNPSNYPTCLCIQDAVGLMNAITIAIRKMGKKIAAIVHGPCVYSTHSFDFDSIPSTRDGATLRLLLDSLGDRSYLIKEADANFMIEHEYRYLWLMDEPIAGDCLDIVVENPTLYATQIEIPPHDRTSFRHVAVSNSNPIVIRPGMLGNSGQSSKADKALL